MSTNSRPPIVRLLLALIVLLTMRVGCAHAQSFDCRRASTNVEQSICNDVALASLDNEVSNQLHYLLAFSLSQRAFFLKNERNWLADRNRRCETIVRGAFASRDACLKLVYDRRIDELKNLIQIIREVMPPDRAASEAILGGWTGFYGNSAIPFYLVVRRNSIDVDDRGRQPSCLRMDYDFLGQRNNREFFLAVNPPRGCQHADDHVTKYFLIERFDNGGLKGVTFRDCITSKDLLKLVRNPNAGDAYCGELGLLGPPP